MMNFNQMAQAGSILSSLGNLNVPQRQDIITVNGLQEAKDYRLNKGDRVAMIDSGSDILYIKECDDIGKYSLKVFECKEITDRYEKENTPAVISRAEFDNLMQSIKDVQLMLGGKNEHNVKKQDQNGLKFSDK